MSIRRSCVWIFWGVGSLLAILLMTIPGSSLAARPLSRDTFTRSSGRSTALSTAGSITVAGYLWEPVVAPNGADYIYDLAVDPANAYRVFAATSTGLYKTGDAGQSWSQAATTTLYYAGAVAIAPSNPLRVYAASWDLYRSDDGGDTWNLIASPPSQCGISIAPSNENRVYARACYGSGQAVFRSDDGGQTWITPTVNFTASLTALVVSPIDAGLLIASDYERVYRSTNAGVSWSTIPVGNRYSGQPVFEPVPPYVLYLGHYSGLLRSTDGGQTWQGSDTVRGFSALIASPFVPGEVLGGDRSAAWQIDSTGNAWSALPWNAPARLRSIWRSSNDNRVLYVQTDTGLWRYIYRVQVQPFTVFLPLVQSAKSTPIFPIASQQALAEMNIYRARVGDVPFELDAAINAAAQSHANYYMQNRADSSAWTYGPHGEVAGKPYYTGQWPHDRDVAAGYPNQYPWWSGSEVMHFIGDPIISVDGWMATIYHRVIPLDPGANRIGYGYGKHTGAAVDVMDFGGGPTDKGLWTSAIPHPLAYPVDGQTDVPRSWNGGESPNPLPPGASGPVGYPFTLQGVRGTLSVTFAQMRDALGHIISVYPNPSDCAAFNCYAIIPVSPYQSNMMYTVSARGIVDTVAFSRTWTFKTGTASYLAPSGADQQIVPPGPPILHAH